MPELSDAQTQLGGRSLWLARLAWLLVVLLVIAVLSEIVPVNYRITTNEWFVTQARPAFDFNPSAYDTFVRALTVMESAVALLCIVVGLIVFRYKSDDRMGLFVSATLIMLSMLAISTNADVWHFPRWLSLPPIASSLLTMVVISSFLLFFHLFPEGRFQPRWTRWAAYLGIIGVAPFALGSHVRWPSWLDGDTLYGIFGITLLASIIVSLMAQANRYRKASGTRRQQMKWVIFGLVAWLSSLFVSLFADTFLGRGWDSVIGAPYELVALAMIPLTVGVAILRYRLWDVDVIINRTLVYGALTAAVLGLYGLAVGAVGALAPAQNQWLVAALGLIIAFTATVPLRNRLQALADRWLPVPNRSAVPEQIAEDKPAVANSLLRWARVAWLIIFGLLAWRVLARITVVGLGRLVAATRAEWAVQLSLRALPAAAADSYLQYLILARFGALAVFWLVAFLVFWRKRDEWMALYVSFVLMLNPFSLILGDEEDPVLGSLGMLSIGMLLLLFYLFPDGRFIPRSRKWRFRLVGAVVFVPIVSYPLVRVIYPDSLPGEWAYASFMFAVVVTMVGGVASQLYRYRRVAGPIQQQQTKWVLLGMSLQLLWATWVALWLSGVLESLNVAQPLSMLVQLQLNIFVFLALPLTIGVAMLRYRLWDVDIIINRALVFAALTALVAVVYVLVVGLLGVLFQAGGNVLLSILATGLIAILFNPLRLRLQGAVNRLMYGERDDPATVFNRLGKRLEETAVPAETLPNLAQTIALTLKLPYVGIAMREGEAYPVVASHPSGATVEAGLQSFPLLYQSEEVGRLLVMPRASNELLTPADRRLLQNIARQAGAAVHAAQLTIQLQRSRQRLVTTREEERRRLRRDLHDGLGPQLATLAIKTDTTRNHLRRDPDAAEALLIELKGQIQEAIQDIRRLVYELRPPALDQLGLVSALKEYAVSQNGHNAMQIVVDAPEDLPTLPAAVEVAAYRISLEAITNAARHAQARLCTVRLWLNGGLQLEVIDDGCGLSAHYEAGVGLTSMRERAAELGGSFTIEGLAEGGTAVRASLPLLNLGIDSE